MRFERMHLMYPDQPEVLLYARELGGHVLSGA
jgi:hypothetical protein